MQIKKVKINPKLRHENVPCTADHFEQYIRDCELTVVHLGGRYIRVQDGAGEEWGLFEGQYKPCG